MMDGTHSKAPPEPTLPPPSPAWANGAKVWVPVRLVRRSDHGLCVTRPYIGGTRHDLPEVWLPARLCHESGTASGWWFGITEILVPVWLYRKVYSQLVAEPSLALVAGGAQ